MLTDLALRLNLGVRRLKAWLLFLSGTVSAYGCSHSASAVPIVHVGFGLKNDTALLNAKVDISVQLRCRVLSVLRCRILRLLLEELERELGRGFARGLRGAAHFSAD